MSSERIECGADYNHEDCDTFSCTSVEEAEGEISFLEEQLEELNDYLDRYHAHLWDDLTPTARCKACSAYKSLEIPL